MENLKLHIDRTYKATLVRVQLEGALCGMDAIELKSTLLNVIGDIDIDQGMHLDLSRVDQIDLGGLNTVAITYRKLQGVGQAMELLIPNSGPVQDLIALTKMHHFLPLKKVATA